MKVRQGGRYVAEKGGKPRRVEKPEEAGEYPAATGPKTPPKEAAPAAAKKKQEG